MPVHTLLDKHITLWRYLSLEKLLHLLQSRTLYFSQLSKLHDPYEGRLPIGFSTGIVDLTELPDDVFDLKPIQGQAELLKDESLRSEMCVSCWRNCPFESAAMWSVYSKNSGVAIKTTVGHLAESLNHNDVGIEIAAVDHMDFEPMLIVGAPWKIKRTSFDYEKEIRAAIRTPQFDRPGRAVPVTVETLLGEIHISPESEPWIEDVVRKVVQKFGFNKAVKRSELYTLK